MPFEKLTTVDAFVVSDLAGADVAAGIVRCAPKILRDGAELLARSATYTFASFGWPVAGASAGINAPAEGRDEAVAAFVAELGSRTAVPRLLLDAGKGVDEEDLADLRAVDPRGDLYRGWRHHLAGLSAAVAAGAAGGGLAGVRVAIETLDPVGTAFAAEATAAGATVVAVGTGRGLVHDPSGLPAADVVAAGSEEGPAGAARLGPVEEGRGLADVAADVLAVGSKPGVLDHLAAASVVARVLVPIGPAPVTARGLAVLNRAGCAVVPDFLALAGPAFAAADDAPADLESLTPTVNDRVAAAVRESAGHPEGLYLGACERAEAFLATWQDELPFGRPLA